MACGILVPCGPGTESLPSALGVWSLSLYGSIPVPLSDGAGASSSLWLDLHFQHPFPCSLPSAPPKLLLEGTSLESPE